MAAVAVLAAVGAAVAGVTATHAAVPSSTAGGTTVVVHGTSFPDPSKVQLSFVGCQDLYERASQTVQPMVGRGPGSAPSGDRSLAFDLAGGDAVGAVFNVSSVLSTTTAGVMVHADGGTATGVAYVGYQAPQDAGTQRMWLGRAELTTPGGAWQTVDVVGRVFSWRQVDMSTHETLQPSGGAPATVANFVASHGGDGPGLFTAGFGCNGVPFNIDDFRIGGPGGVTTYDLEGLTTSVRMVAAGLTKTGTTLRGALSTDTGDGVPGATLLLEQADSADGPWKPADVVPVQDGVATTTVSPDQRTFYRWRFVDRPLAAGSVSSVIAVDGTDEGPSDGPSDQPSGGPSGKPSGKPSVTPSATTGTSASATPSNEPSDGPSNTATQGPSDQVSPHTSQEPSAGASDSSTAGPAAGPSEQPTARPSDSPSDSGTPAPTAGGGSSAG